MSDCTKHNYMNDGSAGCLPCMIVESARRVAAGHEVAPETHSFIAAELLRREDHPVPTLHVGQRVRITDGALDGGFSYIVGCGATVLSQDKYPAIDIKVDGHGRFSSPVRWLTPAATT